MCTLVENQVVPKDAIRVRINPSVEVIKAQAFENCTKLKEMEFMDGLEGINDWAILQLPLIGVCGSSQNYTIRWTYYSLSPRSNEIGCVQPWFG